MSKVIYFCLECNKGTKKIDKKSDEVYIQKLLKYYFDQSSVKIRFEYLHGKNNYQKIYQETLKKCKSLEKDKVISDYQIILVLDKDNFTSNSIDSTFVDKVENFISNKPNENASLIWFTKDIEHVLLGKRTTHQKTQKAKNFEITEKNGSELKTRINCIDPKSDRSSNFYVVVESVLKRLTSD